MTMQGFANLGDSAELASVGYLLASDSFQDGILQGNMTFNGSLVASISLVGMIIGGLVVSGD